jgi:RHS repeat-associated protein
MTVSATPYDYEYDDNGNLIRETLSRHFTWNHADQLATFATQVPGGAEPSIHAHYLYDAAGERMIKLVRRQGGLVEITRYLAGFEHRRWATGGNNHIHVTDDKGRIALVRAGPAHPRDRGPAIAYQLTDHLGSVAATLDGSGTVTNREEYTPYGETSFGSYALKRYRYTGRERDEESGLNYHSARYYAPWISRWTACDPLGAAETHNAYRYCQCSPLLQVDTGGMDSTVSGNAPENIFDQSQWVCSKKDPGQGIADAKFDPGHLNPWQIKAIQGQEPSRYDYGWNSQGSRTYSSKESVAIEDDLNHPSRQAARNLKTMVKVSIAALPSRIVQAGLAIYSLLTADDPSQVAGELLVGMMFGELVSGGSRSLRDHPLARGSMTGGTGSAGSGGKAPDLLTITEKRMRELGIPEQYIGIKGIREYNGRGYDPNLADPGSNVATRGISVGAGVARPWSGEGVWPEWDAASILTRIDAVIAHEWDEFLIGENNAGHPDACVIGPLSDLPISPEARTLLLTHPGRGG